MCTTTAVECNFFSHKDRMLPHFITFFQNGHIYTLFKVSSYIIYQTNLLSIGKTIQKALSQGLLYTGRARASLGLSSLGQFFRQCLSPHFLLWNLDFWYARSLGQNEKNWKKHFSKNWKLTFSGPSIDFWLFFSSLSLYWPQATPLDLQP